jgi:hypothetical protein
MNTSAIPQQGYLCLRNGRTPDLGCNSLSKGGETLAKRQNVIRIHQVEKKRVTGNA